MEIMIGKAASAIVPVAEEYRKFDGDFVTLIVVAVPEFATSYSAMAANGRVIALNGYAFENEFKELCAALGVRCDY